MVTIAISQILKSVFFFFVSLFLFFTSQKRKWLSGQTNFKFHSCQPEKGGRHWTKQSWVHYISAAAAGPTQQLRNSISLSPVTDDVAVCWYHQSHECLPDYRMLFHITGHSILCTFLVTSAGWVVKPMSLLVRRSLFHGKVVCLQPSGLGPQEMKHFAQEHNVPPAIGIEPSGHKCNTSNH